MPWVARRSTVLSHRRSTEESRGSNAIHGFFYGLLPMEGHTMEDPVLEQAIQALCESDRQIVRLLTLRYQLAAQLAQISLGQGQHVSPEERVSAVVSRLVRRNPGPLDGQRLRAIFATVIELTEPLSTGFSTKNGAPKKG
jgi:chorismate mutase